MEKGQEGCPFPVRAFLKQPLSDYLVRLIVDSTKDNEQGSEEGPEVGLRGWRKVFYKKMTRKGLERRLSHSEHLMLV